MPTWGFIDLEIKGEALESVGALRGEDAFSWGPRGLRAAASYLRGIDVLVGHNITWHDRPWLERLDPGSPLLKLPVLDTLVLSPLTWPARPYHRLVKDDKLVRATTSDPLADCRSCRVVFDEALASWRARRDAPLAVFARAALGEGYRLFFDEAGVAERPLGDAWAALRPLLLGRVCEDALRRLRVDAGSALPLAYAAAWIGIPEPGSVLPPWVRRQFPRTRELLVALRDGGCGRCAWCGEQGDPRALLQRYFGFDFRPEPRAPDGGSLQEAITRAGLQDRPLYAVLPTGGGKSVCFQLPAMVRHARRGLLTVVISPLQSLMKDQVDNLRDRSPHATAVYGMLTPLERRQRLDKVQSGETDLLYVSPEQLRSPRVRRVLRSREVGAWVFDEAHCLATWGHDFRTDYLYAPRFIRETAEAQGVPIPPIQCFTATSQQAVTREILALVEAELGQQPEVFLGGTERPELVFHVEAVPEPKKPARILEILEAHLPPGAGVVFCATRRGAERLASFLEEAGVAAAAYHAGLEPPVRREVQDAFLAGSWEVICATSAFGMGVDKPDVRVVVHHDVPGSLESYLQQAGRAGRDRQESHCYLLFQPDDVEQQFRLAGRSELRLGDLRALWRGIRRVPPDRRGGEEVRVLSAGELLQMDELAAHFDPKDHMARNRVEAGLSWLERAHLLQRDENSPQVWQGRPLVPGLREAEAGMKRLRLSPAREAAWKTILQRLFEAPPDQGLDAAELAELAQAVAPPRLDPREATRRLFQDLEDMGRAGLVKEGLEMTAVLRYGTHPPSRKRLERLLGLELALVARLPEHDHLLVAGEGWARAGAGALCRDDALAEHAPRPDEIALLIRDLAHHGLGLEAQPASADVRGRSPELSVQLRRPWREVADVTRRRVVACQALFAFLDGRRPAGARGNVTVAFNLEEAARLFRPPLLEARDPLALAENALLHLHEHRVITLQGGLAVFRMAMTLRRRPGGRTRLAPADMALLERHYARRRVQIHVMHAYAQRGQSDVGEAQALAHDWFRLDDEAFLRRWFPGDRSMLSRATTRDSWHRIVEELQNAEQQAVVTAPAGANLLVLAGPGSGKTRVLVHRVAWLLRVERVRPEGILVVCYTRANAVEIRRRLSALVGADARGVLVHTLHGIALRLLGLGVERGESDFDRYLREATAVLNGGTPAGERDEVRDALLRGYTHILVDEYQDVNADQYALLSALAGRTVGSDERRLAIFAVGDDDQNIYAFRGASTEHLRSFQRDYAAESRTLLTCYRCAEPILRAAEGLVAGAPERMKAGQRLRVARQEQQDGVARRVDVSSASAAARFVAQVVTALQGAGEGGRVAVLARRRQALHPVRAALRLAGQEVRWPLRPEEAPPLHRVREVDALLGALEARRGQDLDLAALAELVPAGEDPWCAFLAQLLDEWRERLGEDGVLAAEEARHDLWDAVVTERGERAVGGGVHLGTLHGAKGLEFDHVFVVDDGLGAAADQESERRLLYVGMTRARRSLHLVVRRDRPAPWMRAVQGLDEVDWADPGGPDLEGHEYGALGLGDVWLDWAGQQHGRSVCHEALAAARFGDPVSLDDGRILDAAGRCLARLSAAGRERWAAASDLKLRILALTVRDREQTEGPWQERLAVERWLVPVCEAVWRR